jgi:hypothetical protein
MKNLWPKFKMKDEESPKSIISKQADFFDGLDIGLRARVNSVLAHDDDIFETGEKIWFVHTFRIQVSALDGFTFTLFRAKHKTTKMYPIELYDNLRNIKIEAESPEKLNDALAEIFRSNETNDAICNLITQI